MKWKYFLFDLVLMTVSFQIKAQDFDISAMTLDEALRIGIENNLTLKRSQLELIGTEAALLEAKGQRIPSLSTSASGQYNWGRSENKVTSLFESRNFGNIGIGISSNVTVFA